MAIPSDRFSEFFHAVYSQDKEPKGTHGWIQWKGTDVCMDIYCKCGCQTHFDGDFLYYYECPACHAKYAVGSNIAFIELTPEQAEYVDKEQNGFKSSDPG